MKIYDEMISNSQRFLETEEYETDTLSLDKIDIGDNGNVLQWSGDPKVKERMINLLNTTRSMYIFIVS